MLLLPSRAPLQGQRPRPIKQTDDANDMARSDPEREGLPPIPNEELPEWLLGAMEKEFEIKRKLGQKIAFGKTAKCR